MVIILTGVMQPGMPGNDNILISHENRQPVSEAFLSIFVCIFYTDEIAISTTSMQTVNDNLWLFHVARKNKN